MKKAQTIFSTCLKMDFMAFQKIIFFLKKMYTVIESFHLNWNENARQKSFTISSQPHVVLTCRTALQ